MGITSDQNGIIWFTETRANKIGRLDPESGQIREYDIPTKNAKPTTIAVDSRGNPWFTLQDAHKIGQLDPRTGRVREWDVGAQRGVFGSVGRAYPTAIAIDANDVVWFSELRNNTICSLDPTTGEITKMAIPGGLGTSASNRSLAIDALGSVWFIDHDRIGKLD
jgi:virginiamycin B lyase